MKTLGAPVDVNDVEHEVEIKVMKSAVMGYTLWVNIDGVCMLRVNCVDKRLIKFDLPDKK